MFSVTLRRLAQSAKDAGFKKMPPIASSNFAGSSLHKNKKVWPPNFKELSHQQQLRFEKKYKRRILLASRSPRWEKGVKYAQLLTIAAALVWLLFYSEFEWWGQQYKPSEEIRRRASQIFGILDEEKRYERRKDMVEPGTTGKDSGSESK